MQTLRIYADSSMAHVTGPQLRHVSEDLVEMLEKSQLALDAVARKMDAEFSARYEKAGVRAVRSSIF